MRLASFLLPAFLGALAASPGLAEDKFPVDLKFEPKSYQQVRALLNDPGGKLVPAKIDARRQDLPNPPNINDESDEVFTPRYLVAEYDLNDDGKQEVLLYRSGPGMCGSAGCEFDIYQQGKDGAFKNILGKQPGAVGTDGDVLILANATAGYHDIILGAQAVWAWNGRFYDFDHRTH